MLSFTVNNVATLPVGDDLYAKIAILLNFALSIVHLLWISVNKRIIVLGKTSVTEQTDFFASVLILTD